MSSSPFFPCLFPNYNADHKIFLIVLPELRIRSSPTRSKQPGRGCASSCRGASSSPFFPYLFPDYNASQIVFLSFYLNSKPAIVPPEVGDLEEDVPLLVEPCPLPLTFPRLQCLYQQIIFIILPVQQTRSSPTQSRQPGRGRASSCRGSSSSPFFPCLFPNYNAHHKIFLIVLPELQIHSSPTRSRRPGRGHASSCRGASSSPFFHCHFPDYKAFQQIILIIYLNCQSAEIESKVGDLEEDVPLLVEACPLLLSFPAFSQITMPTIKYFLLFYLNCKSAVVPPKVGNLEEDVPLLVEAEVERPRSLFLLLAGTPVLLASQFDYDVAELKILNFTVVKMKKKKIFQL